MPYRYLKCGIVHPIEVVKPVILLNVTYIMLCHNHLLGQEDSSQVDTYI
ncbi:JAB domain-containing protein [Viridibacillus arvi]